MTRRKTKRWWAEAGLVAAQMAWVPGIAAQTLPPVTNSELLLPPALRAGASDDTTRVGRPSHRSPSAARPNTAPRGDPPRRAAGQRGPGSAHPVDLGVVMRGGSGTPRLVSPLGSTQAVRESGNAFGAGLRIGF